MNTPTAHITPPLTAQRAQDIARSLDLRALPADFLNNPYPVYAALRETEPFKRMPDGSFFLTRHADLVAVYRDAKVFSSDKQVEFGPKYNHAPFNQAPLATPGGVAPLFEHHTNSLVFNDPPLHTRVRRLIMGALTRRAIEAMEPGLVQLVDSLLDRIEAQGGGDLIEDFASAIPVEIIGNLLDVPQADREPLRAWSLAILGALEPALSPEQEALGNRSVTEFLAYLRELVAKRRQHPGDPEHDVLTRLIQGEENGDALSEVELLHNCVFLLNAGHETTTNLIGNGLEALMRHRDQLERLVREPALIAPAIEELLRFESPLQLNNRLAGTDIVLPADPVSGRGEFTIAAGSFITLGVGAANRDPEVFDDPQRLDIARRPNPQLAFGHGAHACAGMNIARLEARVAIGRLVTRYPDIEPAAPAERDRRIRFRGFRKIPVALNPRSAR